MTIFLGSATLHDPGEVPHARVRLRAAFRRARSSGERRRLRPARLQIQVAGKPARAAHPLSHGREVRRPECRAHPARHHRQRRAVHDGQLRGSPLWPGQLLDAQKYFIVLPDGIGHGKSSKPSDGLHARFPHYGYDDMVEAQYRLLREKLGVDHLRLVLGTSMGGMHTWLWGEQHAKFMDALMPLASLPTPIAGRNRVMRKMIMDAIRGDPAWNGGEYTAEPREGLTAAIDVLMLMGSSPLAWQAQAPTRDAADAFYEEALRKRLASADANDMLYAFDASRDYDPSPRLESIEAPLVAVNSADDVINPPELGILEKQIQRVRRGKAVLLPITPQTRGHGTHSLPAIWKQHLADLLQRSGQVAAK